MLVAIVGPNLPREAKATFHVHRAGCADLSRGWIRRHSADAVPVDMASRLDVEADVYDFAPAENEGYALGDYQTEFYFAPCVDDLPLTAPAGRVHTTHVVHKPHVGKWQPYCDLCGSIGAGEIFEGDAVAIADRHAEIGGFG